MAIPSTKEEVEEAEAFNHSLKRAPYEIPSCFDHKCEPWTFLNGKWQRTKDIGDPNAAVGEIPIWGEDD